MNVLSADVDNLFGATPLLNLAEKPFLANLQLASEQLNVLCVSDCRGRLLEIARLSEKLQNLRLSRSIDFLVAVALEECSDPVVPASEERYHAIDGELSATVAALENICPRVIYARSRAGWIQPPRAIEPKSARLTQHSCDVREGMILVAADLVLDQDRPERNFSQSRLWPPWGSSLMTRLNTRLDSFKPAAIGSMCPSPSVISIASEPAAASRKEHESDVLLVQPAQSLQHPGTPEFQIQDGCGTVFPGSVAHGYCTIVHMKRELIREDATAKWRVMRFQPLKIY